MILPSISFRSCLLAASLAAGCLPAWAEGYRLTFREDPHEEGLIIQGLRDGKVETGEFPLGETLQLQPQTNYLISFSNTFPLEEETPFRKVVFEVSNPDLDVDWQFVYRQDFDSMAHPVQDVGSPGAHNRFLKYLWKNGIGLYFQGRTQFHGLPWILEPLHLAMEDVEMACAGEGVVPVSKSSGQGRPKRKCWKKLQF